MDGQQAISTYRRQQVETATPGQLIVLLYDAAVRHCKGAQESIERKDRDGAARHLLKAQDIVAELMGSLNVDAGGELAGNLLRLYEYVYRRLVHANVRKDASAAQEAEGILAGLRDAWAQASAGMPVPSTAAGRGPTA